MTKASNVKPTSVGQSWIAAQLRVSSYDVKTALKGIKPVHIEAYGKGVRKIYALSDVQPLIDAKNAKRTEAQVAAVAVAPPVVITGVDARIIALNGKVDILTESISEMFKQYDAHCTAQNAVLLKAMEKQNAAIHALLVQLGVQEQAS